MLDDLKDITVVSLEQAVAAPYASCRLADAGARVIKIERNEGDFARRYDRFVKGQSAYFVWLNRGKESMTLDIKDKQDADLLRQIIAKADVFIQNLSSGAAARAGFGHETLREIRSELITCNISGYGQTGPYQNMKAYDLLVQAESGLCAITGPDESPSRVGISVCDIAAGMYAHAAILQALYQRQQSGKGRNIDVSLFDAMADWMSVPLLQYDYGKVELERAGLHHLTIAPYGAYPCKNNETVLFSVQNEREWESFCKQVLMDGMLAQDARFKDNTARLQNRIELDLHIKGVFEQQSRKDIIEKLKKAEIAFGLLNTVGDLVAHPQLRRVPVETSLGEIKLPAPPAQLGGKELALGKVPGLGEHKQSIIQEFQKQKKNS